MFSSSPKAAIASEVEKFSVMRGWTEQGSAGFSSSERLLKVPKVGQHCGTTGIFNIFIIIIKFEPIWR